MMKNILKEWKIFLKEAEISDEKFQRNLVKVEDAFPPDIYGDQDITPENSKILTQIRLGDEIGRGTFGKAFNIIDSSLIIKLFMYGVDEDADIKRIKDTADKIFAGTATSGDMHYFEYGTIGDEIKYALMPRIIPFEKSVTYKLNPELFLKINEALDRTLGSPFLYKLKSYADFRDEFYENLAKEIASDLKYTEDSKREVEKEKFFSDINEFDETIHKILRIAHKTYLEHGGTDLHLGNLGFFAQKPDDWFYFDM